MIAQTFLPSSYYPEYFKADLELGTPHEFSFSSGLDLALHSFLGVRQNHLNQLSPSETYEPFISTFLEGIGLTLTGLSEEHLKGLYSNRIALFKLRGTQASLDLLANLHFGDSHSIRGLGFPQFRLNLYQLNAFRLTELPETGKWITYSINNNISPDLENTFLLNSRIFVPSHIKINIRRNFSSNKKGESIEKLRFPFSLTQRRIPCHISRK
jgi:hypothetical protein